MLEIIFESVSLVVSTILIILLSVNIISGTDNIKKVKIKLDSLDIRLPKYETQGSSGMDIRAYRYALPSDLGTTLEFTEKGLVLPPHERVLIKTGIKVEIPKDMEIQIRPRSGLALKHGITLANTPATIDEDYRGDLGLILLNTSNHPFTIKKGDRLGQLVLATVNKIEWEIVDENLSDTKRGQGGFGHTGK